MAHRINKGLDLPIEGAPVQTITAGPGIARVALIADDFPGLKPRVRVAVGQAVRRGELLCEDAGTPGVRHTALGAGRVESINRGARRVLHSIVIELSEGERRGTPSGDDWETFSTPGGAEPETLGRVGIRDLLVESGMWTAFRTRPFGKVPHPEAVPSAIFVTAIDTNPLAADPGVVLADGRDGFELGLRAIAKLSGGKTYLCVRAGSEIGVGLDAPVTVEEFAGPHPAGTAGVHIHMLEPVGRTRTVWTIGYQDVVSIGRTLRSGHLDVSRIIAIGGPPVPHPRLIRTRLGASIGDLAKNEEVEGDVRWISGSVLSGKAAHGDVFGYMGRYDVQLSVLREGGDREFLAWLAPGRRKFSVLPVFLSKFLRGGALDISTDAHGSRRAIIPIGLYERVMPMDILPTFLLRALAADDIERAEELGCLELIEEDLALCGFVDPGKTDFAPMLRRNLESIERAG
jgi:Na+-transporting NADH:ubiquinone oxidoreductase subunit A